MSEITTDQLLEAARSLEKDEFSRDDLADKLSVKKSELKDSVKQARQDGRLEKVREDESGAGVFTLTA